MLIRYMTSLPSFQAEHKLVVFLAPTVALVEQQSEAVRSHTPLKVATYTGDTGEALPRLCALYMLMSSIFRGHRLLGDGKMAG